MAGRLVENARRRFSSAIAEGRDLRIEDLLHELPERDREEAFRALLRMELQRTLAGGEAVNLARYLQRFADDRVVVEQVAAELGLTSDREGVGYSPHADTVTFSEIEEATGQHHVSDVAAGPLPPPLAQPDTAPPTRIGRFEVRGILGRGGFGTVYKAFDPKLERPVAIKVPRPELLAAPRDLERFLREARAAAVLNHPHICPVHDVGELDGLHYIVMAYIEGNSLSEVLKQRGSLPQAEAARIVSAVAGALDTAHDHGIIHRDLKPSNIMFDAGGKPIVMDFGLAVRTASNDPRLTQSGAIVGTPAYMSPEQMRGDAEVGPASDVYSLGVVLYELVTGQRPFRGKTVADVIAAALSTTAKAPSALNPNVSNHIDVVCARAMSKAPDQRFASMAEFAAALEQQPQQAPTIRIRHHTVPARSWKTLGAGGLLIGLLVLGSVLWFRRPPLNMRSGREHPSGDTIASETSTSLDEWTEQIAAGLPVDPADDGVADLRSKLVEYRIAHVGTDEGLRSAELMERLAWPVDALRREDIPQDEFTAAGAGDPAAVPYEVVGILGDSRLRHWDVVRSVCFSPNGDTIVSGGDDATVRVWDVDTGRSLAVLTGHTRSVGALAFSPDGALLASADVKGEVRLWRTDGYELPFGILPHSSAVTTVAFNPEGTLLAAGCSDGSVTVWNVADMTKHQELIPHRDSVTCVAFVPHAELLATSSSLDPHLRLWNTQTWQEEQPLLEAGGGVTCVAFNPGGTAIATSSVDHTVRIRQFDDPERQISIPFRGDVPAIAFSGDGLHLFAAESTGVLTILDAGTLDVQAQIVTDGYGITSLSGNPDGSQVAVGTWSGAVRIWEVSAGVEVHPVRTRSGTLYSIDCDSSGHLLAGSGEGQSIKVWDLGTGELRAAAREHPGEAGICFDPVTGSLLSTGADRRVVLWHPLELSIERELPPVDEAGSSVSFAPGGGSLAMGSYSGNVLFWKSIDTESPDWVAQQRRRIRDLEISPDGRLVAVAADRSLVLFDGQSGVVAWSVEDDSTIWSVAFSPDGRMLVTAGAAIRVYDVDERVVRHQFTGHAGNEVNGSTLDVSFSPDGSRFASCGTDGVIRVWSSQTRQCLREIPLWKPQGSSYQVIFTPDGRHLVTSNVNGTLYVLRLESVKESGLFDSLGKTRSTIAAEAPFDAVEAADLQASWAERLGVDVAFENRLGMEFRLIPPGRFQMGAPAEQSTESVYDELPHNVCLTRPLYVGTHEVTVGQFRSFVDSTGYVTDAERDDGGHGYVAETRAETERRPEYNWRNVGWKQPEDAPVVNITWRDAEAFCAWLSNASGACYRLPSEAEWEFACRAGTLSPFHCGTTNFSLSEAANLPDRAFQSAFANYDWGSSWNDGFALTAPVGSFKPNAFGLHDMHGNVWEFCSDWYAQDYYSQSPLENPVGPVQGERKVFRGGGYPSAPELCRSANRGSVTLDDRGLFVGFRVVRDVEPPPSGGTWEPPGASRRSQPLSHALEFDGEDSYVELPMMELDPSSAVTLEVWATPARDFPEESEMLQAHIFGWENMEDLALGALHDALGATLVSARSSAASAPITVMRHPGLNIGRRQHLALTLKDGVYASLFVNGERVESSTLRSPLGDRESPPSIGAFFTGLSGPFRPFAGQIDEARISSVIRYTDAFLPVDQFEPDENTIALYHFDEGDGDVLYDFSGNDYHGTIHGATWTRFRPPEALAPFDDARARQLQQIWSSHLGLPPRFENSLGMQFRLLPPGTFTMGAPESEDRSGSTTRVILTEHGEAIPVPYDEHPHEVHLPQAFYLGVHEITRSLFHRFVEAQVYETDAEADPHGGFGYRAGLRNIERSPDFNWREPGFPQDDDHPVVNVSWKDAEAFCRWLSEQDGRLYRLPTEAEWEYACRAGTNTRFSTGNDAGDLEQAANIADVSYSEAVADVSWEQPWNDGHPFTSPVGQFAPNPFGLHDMHGNVWELCRDRYSTDYYLESPVDQPFGPAGGAGRVKRGGSFAQAPAYVRSAQRWGLAESDVYCDQGFRIVLTVDSMIDVDNPASDTSRVDAAGASSSPETISTPE